MTQTDTDNDWTHLRKMFTNDVCDAVAAAIRKCRKIICEKWKVYSNRTGAGAKYPSNGTSSVFHTFRAIQFRNRSRKKDGIVIPMESNGWMDVLIQPSHTHTHIYMGSRFIIYWHFRNVQCASSAPTQFYRIENINMKKIIFYFY